MVGNGENTKGLEKLLDIIMTTEDETYRILMKTPKQEFCDIVDVWSKASTDNRRFTELLKLHHWTMIEWCAEFPYRHIKREWI